MKRRSPAVVLLAVAVVVIAGCGLFDAPKGNVADAAVPAVSSAPASTGLGDSVKDAGDLPDPCTLLYESEVTRLTGRGVTQVDADGQDSDAAVRYCQWQQAGGQLAVFLTRTSASDFATVIADATPVEGIGEQAFELAGHLYVLFGTVQLDVYLRGDGDDENLAKAKTVAEVLMRRI